MFLDYDIACSDCRRYASELQRAFEAAGWEIIQGTVSGARAKSALGLAMIVPDLSTQYPDVDTVINALRNAKIDYDMSADPGKVGSRSPLLIKANVRLLVLPLVR